MEAGGNGRRRMNLEGEIGAGIKDFYEQGKAVV
jgi:hypothetical protein